MLNKGSLLVFACLSVGMPINTVTGQTDLGVAESLEFTPCVVALNATAIDAKCAKLLRPENPNIKDSKTIELSVAKFEATTPNVEADAFTVIQGGPGGSSIDMFLGMSQLFSQVRRNRDILVIDQRGTGRSNKLACDMDDPDELMLNFDLELTKQFTEKCKQNLQANLGADLAQYTTSRAVEDLEALRQAAGYSQLTIYGVSYGTRVAQHFLRQYPQSTRALIIDGVVPIGTNLAGGEIARRSQAAFDALVARCLATTSCKEAHGDLALKFAELRQRFSENQIEVSFSHPESGKIIKRTASEDGLIAAVRLMPYSTEQLALLPMFISQAHDGNYVPLMAWIELMNDSFSQGFAVGMSNSVTCAEDQPFVEQADIENTEGTFFGSEQAIALKAVCEIWPQGEIDDNFLEPFESDVPVLILSGETDPITPPENGEKAHAMFDNSKHIVVPAHGHGIIARGCIPQLATEFVSDLILNEIKTDCVERERALPIFLDASGPTP